MCFPISSMVAVLNHLLQCLIPVFCHIYKYYLQGSKVPCFKNAFSIAQYLSNIVYYLSLFQCEVKHISISQKYINYTNSCLICHFSDPGRAFQSFHFFWKQQNAPTFLLISWKRQKKKFLKKITTTLVSTM